MTRWFAALACALALAGPAVHAADAPMTKGEIRKVDKAQGRLTIRHERIDNLDMAPMTMVFRVAGPDMLDDLAAGDSVDFAAERVDGKLTVTQLRKLSGTGR